MAAQRIPALWSTIWKSAEIYSPAARSARAAAFRAYHPSRRRKQEHLPQQRYGTANEPPPHLGGGKGVGPPTKQGDEQPKTPPKIGERFHQMVEEDVKAEQKAQSSQTEEEEKKEPTTAEGKPQMVDPMLDSGEAFPAEQPPSSLNAPDKAGDSLLRSIPDPAPQQQSQPDEVHAEEHHDKTFDEHSPSVKMPHIDRPRYVHHFDTYGLVKRLVEGGWDEQRAITIMKAVRIQLADNIDLAKEALVSKSDLENEGYLFKAACAELKTEVTTRRKSEQEKMRTERTQLQHEVDILTQRLSQESAALKDDLKGMFDDRKMAVRNEQRDMESKIQQLNYKITVMLQADAKSEVEGLRWLMTRRVLFTLAAVILMTFGGLKAVSDGFAREAAETERKAQAASAKEFVEASAASGGGG